MERTLQQTNSNCIKVVLFGPESTGKSTLAKELADHYNSIYIEEYAREYLQKKYVIITLRLNGKSNRCKGYWKV